jgi:fatty acid desaturase
VHTLVLLAVCGLVRRVDSLPLRALASAVATSVIVSPLLDWMHLNFSFHTEHHLFPAMDGRFLPLVSRLLQEHFPARYHRVPIACAWRRAWQWAAFVEIEAVQDLR